MKRLIATLSCVLLFATWTAAAQQQTKPGSSTSAEHKTATAETSNPFFSENPLPYNYPQFDKIEDKHFMPAFKRGMEKHLAQIREIANQEAEPTFKNTIIALEKSGQLLNRVARIFFNLASADSNERRKEIRRKVKPMLAAHRDKILLNDKLFQRIKALYEKREELGLDDAEIRLIEQYYQDFVHAGALLSDKEKKRVKAIHQKIAEVQTAINQNILEGVKASAVVFDDKESLAGLSETEIEAAAELAEKRGLEGKYIITLENTSIQPIIGTMDVRASRKRIMKASLARNNSGGEYDNTDEFAKLFKLRAELARIMGYPNYAAYRLVTQTAQTPEAVNEMLGKLVPKAVASLKEEAEARRELMEKMGKDFELKSWDWFYFGNILKKKRFDFDASRLKPYLELESVLKNGVFYAAHKLYGITFEKREDLPVYAPNVEVWEVFDADGSHLAFFITDYYTRPSKRGGAWMNAYVSQSRLLNNTPIVANHLNIPKPPEGEPTLLTWNQVETMFHEFGHALHGMFSNVRFPYFSGTSVPRDFVEYPSQANEMWAAWPAVLKNYAVHYKTGEPMPRELLEKVLAAQKFNQGYMTTEYLAAAILDQAWHQLSAGEVPDGDHVEDFEARALKEAGVSIPYMPPRYRTTYFAHIVGGYAAGYYSYIWSEVLAADTEEWFAEHGGLSRKAGQYYREHILSQGGSVDPMTMFTNFYGSEPEIEPLLERRGLLP